MTIKLTKMEKSIDRLLDRRKNSLRNEDVPRIKNKKKLLTILQNNLDTKIEFEYSITAKIFYEPRLSLTVQRAGRDTVLNPGEWRRFGKTLADEVANQRIKTTKLLFTGIWRKA